MSQDGRSTAAGSMAKHDRNPAIVNDSRAPSCLHSMHTYRVRCGANCHRNRQTAHESYQKAVPSHNGEHSDNSGRSGEARSVRS